MSENLHDREKTEETASRNASATPDRDNRNNSPDVNRGMRERSSNPPKIRATPQSKGRGRACSEGQHAEPGTLGVAVLTSRVPTVFQRHYGNGEIGVPGPELFLTSASPEPFPSVCHLLPEFDQGILDTYIPTLETPSDGRSLHLEPWYEDYTRSFKHLKVLFENAVVLHNLVFAMHFIPDKNASDTGIGPSSRS